MAALSALAEGREGSGGRRGARGGGGEKGARAGTGGSGDGRVEALYVEVVNLRRPSERSAHLDRPGDWRVGCRGRFFHFFFLISFGLKLF